MIRHRTTPRLVRARMREAEAMVLRASGMGYDGIARKLGYRSRASAYKAVLRGMAATRDRAALALRVLMFLQFERLLDELIEATSLQDMLRAFKVMDGPLAEAEWGAWRDALNRRRL